MEVYWLDKMESPIKSGTVVCLGMFDGLHLGHQALIREGMRIAKEKNLSLCVHTYDILPINFIHQSDKVAELTPLQEKLDLIKGQQVDITAIDPFNNELLHMSGRSFFNDIVAGKLNARHVVAGFDHRFGYRVDSGKDELEAFCRERDIGLSVIPPVTTQQGDLISSTAIRKAILAGDLALASQMLGREADQGMIDRVQGK